MKIDWVPCFNHTNKCCLCSRKLCTLCGRRDFVEIYSSWPTTSLCKKQFQNIASRNQTAWKDESSKSRAFLNLCGIKWKQGRSVDFVHQLFLEFQQTIVSIDLRWNRWNNSSLKNFAGLLYIHLLGGTASVFLQWDRETSQVIFLVQSCFHITSSFIEGSTIVDF